MLKLLITGASGILGQALIETGKFRYEIHGIYYHHLIPNTHSNLHQINLIDSNQINHLIHTIKPDWIIHTAAMTDVNECEIKPNEASLININASNNLIDQCEIHQIPLVFISTDLIFSGQGPYHEQDVPRPLNQYAKQKLAIETKLLSTKIHSLIIRIPLMFGDTHNSNFSFLQPLIYRLKHHQQVPLFVDELRTPLSSHTIAEGIYHLIHKNQKHIYHLSGNQMISRYDLGKLIAHIWNLPENLLIPIKQNQIKMAASRPKNVCLLNFKIQKSGFNIPSLENSLIRTYQIMSK